MHNMSEILTWQSLATSLLAATNGSTSLAANCTTSGWSTAESVVNSLSLAMVESSHNLE